MPFPILIADTPRAGSWGHRSLVPPNCNLKEAQIAKVFETARRHPEGRNFLACSSDVIQPGAQRVGTELLVLFGLDVAKLTPQQREAAIKAIHDRLSHLGAVIERVRVEYADQPPPALIPVPELGSWLHSDSLANLPVSEYPRDATDATPRVAKRQRRWIVLLFAVGLAGLALVTVWLGSRPNRPNGNRLDKKGKKDKEKVTAQQEKRLREILGQLKVDTDKARRELYFAATKEVKEKVNVADLLGSKRIIMFIDEWNPPSDPLFFVGDAEHRHLLSDLFARAGKGPQSCMAVRELLRSLVRPTLKLRKQAAKYKEQVKDPPRTPYYRLMQEAAASKYTDLEKPEVADQLPFFNVRDLEQAMVLREFLSSPAANEALGEFYRNMKAADDDLARRLEAIRSGHEQIVDHLHKEFREDKNPVFKGAYDALKEFFDSVSEILDSHANRSKFSGRSK